MDNFYMQLNPVLYDAKYDAEFSSSSPLPI